MKLGVYISKKYVTSIKVYTDEVISQLQKLGVEIYKFSDDDKVPQNVDCYWDSRCSGGGAPVRKLMFLKRPLVVTLHGVGNQFLPKNLSINSNIKWYNKHRANWRNFFSWMYFKSRVNAVITVSQYAKEEIVRFLKIDEQLITPIYHGVNKEIFYPPIEKTERKYLLHISSYQPKKNVDRIIEAYNILPEKERIPMKIVAPGYKKQIIVPGLEITTQKITHQQAADLYRGARAFVFPSLHESFGMPIAEAMVCGCPVITSNITACPEIVGDAGILVNPESVLEISNAMLKLLQEEELFKQVQSNALKRAEAFSWEKSAEEHLKIFKSVITDLN
jgi:glycosyltransferase involved in cell wall biosynthesis